ncbi:MAG: hypothetical protein M3N13_03185 [Candidatus Eremiobacteraeota bacterium]|nr:hypothetical protein [Candidatus Eremiobacteraeota bacterium]
MDAAVANARVAGLQMAREAHVTLGAIVAADDVGAPPPTFCGRGVLKVTHPWFPSNPLAEPIVIAHASVRVMFATKPH